MSTEKVFVDVGAGQAGGTAVQTLRHEGFDGRIVLVGAERHLPYERPPLSKSYLNNKEGYNSEKSLEDQQWYDDQGVERLPGTRVASVLRNEHHVVFDDKTTMAYDKLLIATGSNPRKLKVPGADLSGVYYLRTLEDAQTLGAALESAPNVVVVGAGWIGLETASVARAKGCNVTVIEPNDVPLQVSMGTLLGEYFAGLHRGHGVDFQLGKGVVGFAGTDRVSSVTTDDGSEFPADVVIAGVGVTPEVGLFEKEMLADDGGARVDRQMRTDDPDVFAAGDIASVDNPLYGHRIRVEHWANALMDGRIAAQSMLGHASEFDPAPFFFTDQYDIGMEYAGWINARTAADPVIRGDLATNTFHAFWLVDNVVAAGLHVNSWDEGIEPVQKLIRSRTRVDPVKLADPTLPLTRLVEAQ